MECSISIWLVMDFPHSKEHVLLVCIAREGRKDDYPYVYWHADSRLSNSTVSSGYGVPGRPKAGIRVFEYSSNAKEAGHHR